jgi:predicted phosphodiesterase
MRVALLSDIHGNLVALDAVLADMQQHGPFDYTVVAGDLVWNGPWPAEVVDRLTDLNCPVVQGNTDRLFLRAPDDPPEGKEPASFAAESQWMRGRLGPRRVDYLSSLPFSYRIEAPNGYDLLVVHATPSSIDYYISPQMGYPELDAALGPDDDCDWGALAFGHLHVPFVAEWRGRLLADVASTGLPRDGDQRAVYAVLSWANGAWQAQHYRVLYPVPVVAHELRRCGIPRGKHYAERLVRATY